MAFFPHQMNAAPPPTPSPCRGRSASAWATVLLASLLLKVSAAALAISPGSSHEERSGPSSRRTSWVFREFLFNPPTRTDGRSLAFVEIENTAIIPESLDHHRLTGALNFTFPTGTTVPPGGIVVVAPDPVALSSQHAISNVLGGFAYPTANLSSGTLRLLNPAGAVLLDLAYAASAPWPDSSASGHSLVLSRPSYGEGDPRAWSGSADPGGSPGRPEPAPSSPATPLPPSPASPSIPDVVIHEILYHPIGDDSDLEFIELHNPSDTTVDLTGWRLVDGVSFQFPSGARILPRDFVVVARNANRLLAAYAGLRPEVTLGNFQGQLANGGEHIALTRPIPASPNRPDLPEPEYQVVDELTYGDGGAWGQWADGGGSSLELVDPRADRRLAASWADSDESSKAPWTQIEVTGPLIGGVGLINQFQVLAQGAGAFLLDDLEVRGAATPNLLANGAFTSGIDSWIPSGTHSASRWESRGGFAGSGALRVEATARGDTGANQVRTPLSPGLVPGSTATIRARARWLRGNPELILRLRGNHLEAFTSLPVPTNPGTPGAANSRARANAGPSITGLHHSPVLPQAGQAVTLSAQIEDPDSVSRAVVQYRIDPSPALHETPMWDDGTRGDAAAGDGTFTATLPGQPAGTLIAFHVLAVDGAPLPMESVHPSSAPANEALVRFGESQPSGPLGTYRIWMTQATFNQWSQRSPLDNSPLPVTFVYNADRVIHGVGARYAGSPHLAPTYNHPAGNLCGYVLEFPADEPFLGAREIVLDWPGRDATAQQEPLAYWIARELGIPFNHRRPIHLHVNGVTESSRGSLYEDAQQVNGDLVEGWFPGRAGGSLHKIEQWFEFSDSLATASVVAPRLENPTLPDGRRNLTRYRWSWLPRAVQGSANDFSRLFELADAANDPDPTTYAPRLAQLIDVEEWMRVFAVENIVVNFDAWGYDIGKNLYAYFPPDGPAQLFMWDIDWVMLASSEYGYSPRSPLMYRGPARFSPANRDPAVGRMYDEPALQRAYWRAIEDAVQGPLLPDRIAARVNATHAALVAAGVTRSAGSPLARPDQVLTWLRERRDYLMEQLTAVSAPFSASPPPAIVTESRVTLHGTAPIRTAEIAINGIPYPTAWTSITQWSVRVPLQTGLNSLIVSALAPGHRPARDILPASIQIEFAGPAPRPRVRFNEWLALNQGAISDPSDGRFDDWLELFNPGEDPVDLTGWKLRGDPSDPRLLVFPDGSYLEPHGFLRIWADGDTVDPLAGGDLHAPFQLSRDGEQLTLSFPDGSIADQIQFSRQQANVSEGRVPDGSDAIVALANLSPGKPNGPARSRPSNPRILGVETTASGRLRVRWEAAPDTVCRLQSSPSLAPADWSDITPDLSGTHGVFEAVDSRPLTGPRFFRVRKSP